MGWKEHLRRSVSAPDVAIDVGTAFTRLHVSGRPSLLQARSGVPSPDDPREVRPALRCGVVADAQVATALLRPLLARVQRGRRLRPRALACVPSDASAAEKALLIDAVSEAGASAVAVVPEPLAAAIGAGLDLEFPYAQMLVDLGDGVTDMAVIRDGTLVASDAVRLGCSDLRAALDAAVTASLGLRLSRGEADRLVRSVGLAGRVEASDTLSFIGLPVSRGVDRYAEAPPDQLRASIEPVADRIAARISSFLAGLPDDLACEVIESGICLTGGGSLLPGAIEWLVTETRVAVHRADDPICAVIHGAQQMLAERTPAALWGD